MALVALIQLSERRPVDGWMIVGLHGLWGASLLLLFLVAAWAALFRDFPRMEAWWWLSVPYSAGIFCTVIGFGGDEFGPLLIDLLYVYMASLGSAFLWLIGAFRQMSVHGARAVSTRRLVLLGGAFAVLLGPLLVGLMGGV